MMSHTASAVRHEPKGHSALREWVSTLAWALVLALIIRTGVVQTFEIPSGSMEHTLEVGDYLLANKFIYGIKLPFLDYRLPKVRAPKRGDVVIFAYPKDPSQDFVKRLIGVPGDEIVIKDKQVFINGQPYASGHEIYKDNQVLPASAGPRDNFGPVVVPPGQYFMMGDNRDESYDSRFWGFVPESAIKGLAMVKYWSWVAGTWRVRWDRLGRIIS